MSLFRTAVRAFVIPNSRIEAPEGTEVYALSVMRTGRNSLPAGVYVVRYDGKSQKVIMK